MDSTLHREYGLLLDFEAEHFDLNYRLQIDFAANKAPWGCYFLWFYCYSNGFCFLFIDLSIYAK